MAECRYELHRVMEDKELEGCVLLLLANKQDLPNVLSVDEITTQLDLQSLKNNNIKWRRYQCCRHLTCLTLKLSHFPFTLQLLFCRCLCMAPFPPPLSLSLSLSLSLPPPPPPIPSSSCPLHLPLLESVSKTGGRHSRHNCYKGGWSI